jgi:hypothetical protein
LFKAAKRFAARASLPVLTWRHDGTSDEAAIRCAAFDLGTSPARFMKLPDCNFGTGKPQVALV